MPWIKAVVPHNTGLWIEPCMGTGVVAFNGKGKWNIPFCKKPDRFSKSYITKIVNQVARVTILLNTNWLLANDDFRETINSATENDVIYYDPSIMVDIQIDESKTYNTEETFAMTSV